MARRAQRPAPPPERSVWHSPAPQHALGAAKAPDPHTDLSCLGPLGPPGVARRSRQRRGVQRQSKAVLTLDPSPNACRPRQPTHNRQDKAHNDKKPPLAGRLLV